MLFAQKEPQVSHDGLEQRIATVLQEYDAQGDHRTGTEADNASASSGGPPTGATNGATRVGSIIAIASDTGAAVVKSNRA